MKAVILFLMVLVSAAVATASVDDPQGQIPVNISAVGIFQVGISSCEAFWFDTGGSESSTAYILTNGHCMVGIAGMRTVRDATMPSRFWVNNNTLSFKISKIAFATVEGRDIALLPLEATYADLRRAGMTPLKLAAQGPLPGTPVIRVQNPEQGFACQIDSIVQEIREGRWTWKGSYRYGCFRKHGSSGAPVISGLTGEVVSIHNTGGATKGDCSEDNPCEVDGSGNTAFDPNAAYAQSVNGIVNCFSIQGELNKTLANCAIGD